MVCHSIFTICYSLKVRSEAKIANAIFYLNIGRLNRATLFLSVTQAESELEGEREMRQSSEEFIVLTTQPREEAERKLMNTRWRQIRRLRIKLARSETGLSAAERKLKGKRRQIRRLRRKLARSGTELTAADHERELLLDEID